MQTVIHRITENVSSEEVLKKFEDTLVEKKEQYGELSDIRKLVNLYAKHATDNFIVSDKADLKRPLKQGDINLYHESSSYYQKVASSIDCKKETSNMNLQEGVSVTGDHKIIPIEGAHVTIKDGVYSPADKIMNSRTYECKLVESDKPLLITHREHGNIAVMAGKYLVFTQIQPETMRRVLD